MRIYDRLRKQAIEQAKQNGHDLGVFKKVHDSKVANNLYATFVANSDTLAFINFNPSPATITAGAPLYIEAVTSAATTTYTLDVDPWRPAVDPLIRPDMFDAVNMDRNKSILIGDIKSENIEAVAKCIKCDATIVISSKDKLAIHSKVKCNEPS
jgi:hypothetical protein